MNDPQQSTPMNENRTLWNENEVRRAVGVLVDPGNVSDVRILEPSCPDRWTPRVLSGYFDIAEALVAALDDAGLVKAQDLYITLNPVMLDLMARANNRLREARRGNSTSADEIFSRTRILADCDPIRPTGISSTDDEHDPSISRVHDIVRMAGRGGE